MDRSSITTLTWKRLIFAVLIVAVASLLRLWPLESLENKVAWLTFYPAVMLVAMYGGLYAGIIATGMTCIIITFFWRFISPLPFINVSSDWLGMIVFCGTGIMISVIAESSREANLRAKVEKDKAQTANLAKSVFLSNMSHELRTPLTAILGYSKLLKNDTSISKQNNEYLNIINTSGEHLLTLINDILEIAKIESKNVTLTMSNFDLHELLSDLKKMFQLKADAKSISLSFIGISEVPNYIFADPTKLRMVLINLIGNAVKFTQKGGITVRLSSRVGETGYDIITFAVEDTGVGIEEKEMGKLFKFFSQTQSGVISKAGTGLGLAISQEYVRMMGGEITVKSQPEIGSTFKFEVKIQETNEGDDKKNANEKKIIGLKSDNAPPRILVAEDIDVNRQLLVEILKRAGFEVREALNGKDAVDIFATWNPDLIWMDIRMPVMDGLAATRIIKMTKAGEKTKIIALSAHVFEDERKSIRAAGCDDFLSKPFREHEIFDTMARHIGVEYLYENDATLINHRESNIEITKKQILDLRPDLVNNLYLATLQLSQEEISKAVDEIGKVDSIIGSSLKKLEESMDYATLLSLSNPDEGRSTNGNF